MLAAAATVGTLSGIPIVGWTAALVGAILIAAVFAAVFQRVLGEHRYEVGGSVVSGKAGE